MPKLIHLNGPPGIGKSTIAQLYVDRHPGTLNLDIDKVACLIGGWYEQFFETFEMARKIALSMATIHLQTGRDVVLPQLVTETQVIKDFEDLAFNNNAEFHEIVLMESSEVACSRFQQRADIKEHSWHQHIHEIIQRHGGQELLTKIYHQISDFLTDRPDNIVIHAASDKTEETYEAVLSAIKRKTFLSRTNVLT